MRRIHGTNIGAEFNKAINQNVLNEISSAINSLYSDLLYTDDETAKMIIEDKTALLKRVVNRYIEEQKATLLKLRTEL